MYAYWARNRLPRRTQLVPSTVRHPNRQWRRAPEPQNHPLGGGICFSVPTYVYSLIFPPVALTPTHLSDVTWPCWAAAGAAILLCPHTTPHLSPEVEVGRGGRTWEEVEPMAKSGWALAQEWVFLQRRHGGHAKGQHPQNTHPTKLRESNGSKQMAKSQETSKTKWMWGGDKLGQGQCGVLEN